MAARKSTTRGFKRSAQLLQPQIRRAAESRGFAVSRLLTHWAEAVGEEIAAVARPVEISYGRQGFGATLTVLTTGAQAPMLEMQKEALRERVNAVYGYNAIARLRITQTAATGFAEGQAAFAPRPETRSETPTGPDPGPETRRAAADLAAPVGDSALRAALEALGRNVLSRPKRSVRKVTS